MTRIARLEHTKARVAPILYMEGACGVRLKADDNVAQIFKNGRASISLGYIGIHETINALYGDKHIYDDEQLRQKGLKSSNIYTRPCNVGNKKQAMLSAYIPHQVKTFVTVSAAWILSNLGLSKVSQIKATIPIATT